MPGNLELVFQQTLATVRQQRLYVLCSWQGPRPLRPPRPCDAVLSWR